MSDYPGQLTQEIIAAIAANPNVVSQLAGAKTPLAESLATEESWSGLSRNVQFAVLSTLHTIKHKAWRAEQQAWQRGGKKGPEPQEPQPFVPKRQSHIDVQTSSAAGSPDSSPPGVAATKTSRKLFVVPGTEDTYTVASTDKRGSDGYVDIIATDEMPVSSLGGYLQPATSSSGDGSPTTKEPPATLADAFPTGADGYTNPRPAVPGIIATTTDEMPVSPPGGYLEPATSSSGDGSSTTKEPPATLADAFPPGADGYTNPRPAAPTTTPTDAMPDEDGYMPEPDSQGPVKGKPSVIPDAMPDEDGYMPEPNSQGSAMQGGAKMHPTTQASLAAMAAAPTLPPPNGSKPKHSGSRSAVSQIGVGLKGAAGYEVTHEIRARVFNQYQFNVWSYLTSLGKQWTKVGQAVRCWRQSYGSSAATYAANIYRTLFASQYTQKATYTADVVVDVAVMPIERSLSCLEKGLRKYAMGRQEQPSIFNEFLPRDSERALHYSILERSVLQAARDLIEGLKDDEDGLNKAYGQHISQLLAIANDNWVKYQDTADPYMFVQLAYEFMLGLYKDRGLITKKPLVKEEAAPIKVDRTKKAKGGAKKIAPAPMNGAGKSEEMQPVAYYSLADSGPEGVDDKFGFGADYDLASPEGAETSTDPVQPRSNSETIIEMGINTTYDAGMEPFYEEPTQEEEIQEATTYYMDAARGITRNDDYATNGGYAVPEAVVTETNVDVPSIPAADLSSPALNCYRTYLDSSADDSDVILNRYRTQMKSYLSGSYQGSVKGLVLEIEGRLQDKADTHAKGTVPDTFKKASRLVSLLAIEAGASTRFFNQLATKQSKADLLPPDVYQQLVNILASVTHQYKLQRSGETSYEQIKPILDAITYKFIECYHDLRRQSTDGVINTDMRVDIVRPVDDDKLNNARFVLTTRGKKYDAKLQGDILQESRQVFGLVMLRDSGNIRYRFRDEGNNFNFSGYNTGYVNSLAAHKSGFVAFDSKRPQGDSGNVTAVGFSRHQSRFGVTNESHWEGDRLHWLDVSDPNKRFATLHKGDDHYIKLDPSLAVFSKEALGQPGQKGLLDHLDGYTDDAERSVLRAITNSAIDAAERYIDQDYSYMQKMLHWMSNNKAMTAAIMLGFAALATGALMGVSYAISGQPFKFTPDDSCGDNEFTAEGGACVTLAQFEAGTAAGSCSVSSSARNVDAGSDSLTFDVACDDGVKDASARNVYMSGLPQGTELCERETGQCVTEGATGDWDLSSFVDNTATNSDGEVLKRSFDVKLPNGFSGDFHPEVVKDTATAGGASATQSFDGTRVNVLSQGGATVNLNTQGGPLAEGDTWVLDSRVGPANGFNGVDYGLQGCTSDDLPVSIKVADTQGNSCVQPAGGNVCDLGDFGSTLEITPDTDFSGQLKCEWNATSTLSEPGAAKILGASQVEVRQADFAARAESAPTTFDIPSMVYGADGQTSSVTDGVSLTPGNGDTGAQLSVRYSGGQCSVGGSTFNSGVKFPVPAGQNATCQLQGNSPVEFYGASVHGTHVGPETMQQSPVELATPPQVSMFAPTGFEDGTLCGNATVTPGHGAIGTVVSFDAPSSSVSFDAAVSGSALAPYSSPFLCSGTGTCTFDFCLGLGANQNSGNTAESARVVTAEAQQTSMLGGNRFGLFGSASGVADAAPVPDGVSFNLASGFITAPTIGRGMGGSVLTAIADESIVGDNLLFTGLPDNTKVTSSVPGVRVDPGPEQNSFVVSARSYAAGNYGFFAETCAQPGQTSGFAKVNVSDHGVVDEYTYPLGWEVSCTLGSVPINFCDTAAPHCGNR